MESKQDEIDHHSNNLRIRLHEGYPRCRIGLRGGPLKL